MGVWSKLQRLGWAIKYSVVLLYVHLQFLAIGGHSMLQDRITQRRHNKTELPRRSGQVAIVTGGARGIGIKVVQMLLECDMTVIVAGTFVNTYQETVDGFEWIYTVNYLGHFLLTMLLLPALRRAATAEQWARVVMVSSVAHMFGDIDFDDVNRKRFYVHGQAYCQSKLAQVLFVRKLARMCDELSVPVAINAVHPGAVGTDIFDETTFYYLKPLLKLVLKNLEEGAVPVVYAAVSPLMEKKSGVYVSNCREARVKAICDDELVQDRLFDLSLEQVGLERLPF
ncbi:unnamed protein product [Trichogramma brassicae]|uniref:Uncharacterized protein n=1 Tax=Trichogramma brassicae TaxID=86971 RepID=A0A6H5J0P2_9HYME|nr:unnamed protein product [Trichogramma brassicae]